MSKVVVIGGGAAGSYAAITAAKNGHDVTLVEKNEKIGKKIYITGKGRCNLTNASDMEVLFSNVMSNRKFLYSAFYACDNSSVIDFFETNGMATKIERGNRVFPVSDHSSDVISTLTKALRKENVRLLFNTSVKNILIEDNAACGVVLSDNTKLKADSVIVATGGLSYKSTGSTGEGHQMAKKLGHKIVECTPALVPFNIKESWVKELQGLSLKNTAIMIYKEKKKVYEDFGEMLFTHFGVSGPMILSASASIKPALFKENLKLVIDLKPALTSEQLDKRILRDFDEEKNKQFKNSIGKLLPQKLVPVIIELSKINPDKKVNEVSKEERLLLVNLIKNLTVTVEGLRDWNEAIITKGGVSVKEVNPSTMESKLINNLYFAGEVLDLDAMTGGYNLQIAWSTGYLAGISIV
ncbi:MAG: NAD(P)/FAD-dependent oxidoreductase [Agathobacter sp.]|nr:NAD(P)/FAD-dependent oxidoreductase [Agathobacter sp.]